MRTMDHFGEISGNLFQIQVFQIPFISEMAVSNISNHGVKSIDYIPVFPDGSAKCSISLI